MHVRVHVVTFNMAGTLPDVGLPASLFKCTDHEAPDMYVFGTQESCTLSDWEQLVDERLGAGYVKIAQDNLMAISLVVYASKQLAPHVYNIQSSKVACGVGNVLGNKGGVAVSCTIAGTRIMLVTCHLAAHGEHVERRNADYARIAAGLFKAGAVADAGADATELSADATVNVAPRFNPWMAPASPVDAKQGSLQNTTPSQQAQQHFLPQKHNGSPHGGAFATNLQQQAGMDHHTLQDPSTAADDDDDDNATSKGVPPNQGSLNPINGIHHHHHPHSSSGGGQGHESPDSVNNSLYHPQHRVMLPPSVFSHPLPATDFTEAEQPPPLSSLDQMPKPRARSRASSTIPQAPMGPSSYMPPMGQNPSTPAPPMRYDLPSNPLPPPSKLEPSTDALPTGQKLPVGEGLEGDLLAPDAGRMHSSGGTACCGGGVQAAADGSQTLQHNGSGGDGVASGGRTGFPGGLYGSEGVQQSCADGSADPPALQHGRGNESSSGNSRSAGASLSGQSNQDRTPQPHHPYQQLVQHSDTEGTSSLQDPHHHQHHHLAQQLPHQPQPATHFHSNGSSGKNSCSGGHVRRNSKLSCFGGLTSKAHRAVVPIQGEPNENCSPPAAPPTTTSSPLIGASSTSHPGGHVNAATPPLSNIASSPASITGAPAHPSLLPVTHATDHMQHAFPQRARADPSHTGPSFTPSHSTQHPLHASSPPYQEASMTPGATPSRGPPPQPPAPLPTQPSPLPRWLAQSPPQVQECAHSLHPLPPRSVSPTRPATRAVFNKGGSSLLGGGKKGMDASHAHDVVLWSGDLNYRINGSSTAVHHIIKAGMVEVLHANDQLRIQMRKGRVFKGFDEQAIHFLPTFKLLPRTQEYHLQRVPSWTDRILHKTMRTAHSRHQHHCVLKPLYYRSIKELDCSDHRPVVAGYEIHIRPSSDASTSSKQAGKHGNSKCIIS